MSLLRNPIFFSGVVLLVLGLGNWYAGTSRLSRYQGSLDEQHVAQAGLDHHEFKHLSAAMNASLLGPLRDGNGEYQRTQAKVDFYRVAESTGKMFFLLGLGFIAIGVTVAHRRSQPLASPPALS